MRHAGLLLVVAAALIGGIVAGNASAGRGPGTTPCLSAIVTHAEHTESSDGLTREITYRDRLQRCDDRVYITRLVPPAAAAAAANKAHRALASHASHASHEAPDVSALPRLVARAPDGRATLTVLDAESKRLIDVDRGSFETLRFDPSFERASTLIDSRALAEMSRLDRSSNVPGGHWYGRQNATHYVRVLWDEERRVALVIESGSLDGTTRDELHVEIESNVATPTPAAWLATKDFTHVDFADFGD
jgi:hypothetical protein